MKKIYIEPKNTVVVLGIENIICNSIPTLGNSSIGQGEGNGTTDVGGGDNLSREVIKTQDAWEEW